MKSIKPLLSLNSFFSEVGLSYEQGLEEIRKGNVITLKKAGGKNSFVDRSEVVRWRVNKNREALGLAPIQPPTTAQELLAFEMFFYYAKNPDDEKYYMTDIERETLKTKKQEEANAKEEVEVSEEEVEINQDVETEANVDENNTEEDSEDVDDNESEASDSETEEDSEADTNETEEDKVSVEESEEEDEVDNKEEVDSKKE